MKSFFICIVISLVLTSAACATVKTIGHNENVALDTTGFSPRQLEGNNLLKKHCTTCHSQQRIINTVNEWLTSDEKQYEELIKAMMTKKIRLSNGNLSKADSQKIYDLLLSFNTQRHSRQ